MSFGKFASGYDARLTEAIQQIDFPPVTPDAMDDEFNDTTFNTSLWTWMDQGSWTATEANGRLMLAGPASDGNRVRGIYQTPPSAPYTVQAKLFIPAASANAGGGVQLFIGESTAAQILYVGYWGNQIRVISHATPASGAANLGDAVTILRTQANPYIWVQIDYDGTDYVMSWSANPEAGWFELHTASLGYTPTLVGISFNNLAALACIMSVGWFRRVQ